MLPDDRTTTNNNALALPTHVEAMVVAPDRRRAQPMVAFLRQESIDVRMATDVESAFEEALMHPPDVIVIDGRVSEAGGVDLCERLKGNLRTHFVPTIVVAEADEPHLRLSAIASGADAVFSPAVDPIERRTRLWALLRTRALFRRLDRKQRRQGSEIGERRRWLSYLLHDLQGSVAALRTNVDFLSQFAPPAGDQRLRDFHEAVDDACTVFDQLLHNVRTVLNFDRFEAGILTPVVKTARISAIARKLVADLARNPALDGAIEVEVTGPEPEAPIDLGLMRGALLNLVLHCARRGPGKTRIQISSTDARVISVRISSAGLTFTESEKIRLFEPYAQLDDRPVGHGVGLALARAVVESHRGKIWIEEDLVGQGTSSFVFAFPSVTVEARRGKRPA
jgi:signal transduction histidine kinase